MLATHRMDYSSLLAVALRHVMYHMYSIKSIIAGLQVHTQFSNNNRLTTTM